MYTQCPGCLSLYSLTLEQLIQGRARARCGSCNTEFDVLASLAEDLPQPPDTMLTRHLVGDVPVLRSAAPKARPGQRDLFASVDLAPETVAEPAAEPEPASAQPSFATRGERRASLQRRPQRTWMYLNAALVLVLVLQLLYASRAVWLESATVRPWLDAACERLSCRLPPRRDVAQIALVARDVRPHPSEAGALVISATMLNRAAFGQPYPTLEITLSNLDEQRIAMRRLAPQDYLSDARALARGLPPGATATIDLEVFDPGRQAVAFEFKFL
jgi:predicted Zn finger-like uncharacterized protein